MGLLDAFKKPKLQVSGDIEGGPQPKRLNDASDQSPEERALADHVRHKIEEVRASANRIAHEGIWLTNCAYLLGYDSLTYNTASRQFQPINRASSYLKKNRIHVNKILPTIQNRLARLAKNPPKYDVRPESNDTDDKEAARLSLQVLNAMWDRLGLFEKRLSLYMWLQQCGHAYVKLAWDPTLGNMMVDPASGESDYEGDLRAEIVSPFEVFPDPNAKSWDDVQWLIHARVRPLDYFKMNYPEKGHLVKEEAAWLLSIQYENRINSLNSRGPSQGGMQQQMKNSAIELIKYEKKSKQYPKGRMIIVANGVVLDDKELPVGELPWAKFDDVIVGGKYNSESIVTHLRPIQDQYNETIRRRGEWTKRLLAGKYKAARGSGIQQESLNDESGEVLYYTPVPNAPNAGSPEPMQIPIIPQYAYMEEERLNEMINYISGISEVSRGNLPSASMPAVGIQMLVEQDDTRIGVMTEQHEHAWARVGSIILKYVEKYYVMPRKFKIAGKALEYTVKELSGKDLKGNTDVYVIRGSTIPGSKALKRQEIMNTFQNGLLGSPQDPKVQEKVLDMMEFGDVGEIWEDYGLDQSQIKRGIESLERGNPVQANELDNHQLWIQELNRYRKQEKFEQLPPEIQSLIEQTIEDHLQWVIKLMGGPPSGEPLNGPTSPPAGMPMSPPPGGGPPMPGEETPPPGLEEPRRRVNLKETLPEGVTPPNVPTPTGPGMAGGIRPMMRKP